MNENAKEVDTDKYDGKDWEIRTIAVDVARVLDDGKVVA